MVCPAIWEESPFILRSFKFSKIKKYRVPFYTTRYKTKQVILVTTGIGLRFFLSIAPDILTSFRPDLIIFTGFCGYLSPDGHPGKAAALVKLFLFPEILHAPRVIIPISSEILKILRSLEATVSQGITVPIDFPKEKIPSALDIPTVVDMESYFAALLGVRTRTPVLILKTATDMASDPIRFRVSEIIGEDGLISTKRVASMLITHPELLPDFYFYGKRSMLASRKLCDLLTKVLDLPDVVLQSIPHPIME